MIKKIFISILLLTLAVAVGMIATDRGSVTASPEKSSPSDWIKEEQISVFQDKVTLDVMNPIWASFTDTNSMDPFIDKDSHAIEIMPEDPLSIRVGDIISYRHKDSIIIHRVVDIGKDDLGIFYIVKGDNNSFRDPYRVRYEDVTGVVVAIIY